MRRRELLTGVIAACVLPHLGGCRKKRDKDGALAAPPDADRWEERYAVAFDDRFTPTPLELTGRAPNDVSDQRLFAARLGYADVVLLVEVQQVWGRGRYLDQPEQFLEVELGDVLMGDLDRKVQPRQKFRLANEDDLPADLRGQVLLCFLRWAPGADPEFRHHLQPADKAHITLIESMVEHARAEGVMAAPGARSGRKGRRKRKRRKRKEKKRAQGDATQASG